MAKHHVRKWLVMCSALLFLSCFGGYQSAVATTCGPLQGFGENNACYEYGDCGAYTWCTDELCSQTGGCLPGDNTVECVTGGCLNPFQGNCKSCSP